MGLTLFVNRATKIRTGSCHRCGWTSDLHRAHAHDRGPRPAVTYRWLCAECAAELDHPAGSVPVPRAPERSTEDTRHPVGVRS